MSTRLEDLQLHASALRLQIDRSIEYVDAIGIAAAEAEAARPAFAERRTAEPASEAALDARARAIQAQRGASYSDALMQAAEELRRGSNFAEASQSAAALEAQPIEIFKAGMHTDDSGTARQFTTSDIAGMAAAYTPALREAPLTVGHPADDRPAYGWVTGLQATPEGRLLMRVGQVDANFAEIVSAGRFKKRSASFYPPTHQNNPRPGSWYLRHVAWLGAQPPAVPGLRNVAFAGHGGAVCPSFLV